MAKFTTRIELHNGKPNDYEKLHEEMENEGFTRTITTTSGKILKLPTAEYNKEGNFSIEEILTSAREAASRISNSFLVLVTEALNSRKWHGLDEIN